MITELLAQVRPMAADVLQVPADLITAQSSPDNTENWDSVHHLDLVLALEQVFSVQFEPEEIDQMRSIGKIVEVLASKLKQSH
jgi:acyl carrier protein